MRRSPLLNVTVHCPHFDRPVQAQRNSAIDRLVSCSDAATCCDPNPPTGHPGAHARPYPHGCPVFPSLAK
ncbi:MAG: hypothetical protein JWN44_430 [Myxococcales bacterium]|nr:hypothetical protein [Myxococcales bacterium]